MHFRKKIVYSLLGIGCLCNQLSAQVDPSLEKGDKQADYIIVGLGTAGSVLARYLSEPHLDNEGNLIKNDVLVLERGRNNTKDPVVAQGPNFLLQNTNDLYYSPKYAITDLSPDFPPEGGLTVSYGFTSGSGWGGGSAHNSMFAVRGASDYWDNLGISVGNLDWQYNNLLPAMRFLETYVGPASNERGTNGPLNIEQSPPFSPTDSYANAVSAITGSPIVIDYNVSDGNTAVTTGQSYSRDEGNLRSFGFDFLNGILNDNGQAVDGRKLSVLSGAFVNRVIFIDNNAVGVEYFVENETKPRVAYAKKKVILCAGCPFSAAILQRSGVGDANLLPEDISVVLDQPLVGTGLKTHYGIVYVATQPTDPIEQMDLNLVLFADGRGFFGPAGEEGDGIRRFMAQQFAFLPLFPKGLLTALGIPDGANGISAFIWNLQPKSNGTAYIIDSSPFIFPDIRFNLYSDGTLADPASDVSAAVAMTQMVQAYINNAGAGSALLYPLESHFASAETLASFAESCLTFYPSVAGHYTGTCNMGSGPNAGVVSSTDLHVFGVNNLMVADNSIYPLPESGNTSWSAYVAGLRAAIALGFVIPN